MAATFSWSEDNGTQTGSPLHGTTTVNRTAVNWKNSDDSTDSNYSTYPVVAGTNSYPKYQFGVFSGTWNQILNGYFDVTGCSSSWPSNVSLNLKVTSTYATPTTTALSGATNKTAINGSFPTGALTVLFNTTANGPQGASPAASITYGSGAVTQYLVSQLVTTVGAAAGDTPTFTLTCRYDEN